MSKEKDILMVSPDTLILDDDRGEYTLIFHDRKSIVRAIIVLLKALIRHTDDAATFVFIEDSADVIDLSDDSIWP